MEPQVVAATAPKAVDLACAALARGSLIVYPTDTLYAIGGRALSAASVERVRRAKGRPDDRPLPVIASDWQQATSLARSLPGALATLAARFWPGPLTLVLPAADSVPDALTSGTHRVAVRVPALALAREICKGAGPLIATSANRSGAPAATTCAEALAAVGHDVDFALDAGPATATLASTIVDLTGDAPRLVRAGAIDWRDVLAALAQADPR